MKNPTALTINIRMVKVSVLILRRCDTGIASHMGLVNCIPTPSSQASKPKRNSATDDFDNKHSSDRSSVHAPLKTENTIIKLARSSKNFPSVKLTVRLTQSFFYLKLVPSKCICFPYMQLTPYRHSVHTQILVTSLEPKPTAKLLRV